MLFVLSIPGFCFCAGPRCSKGRRRYIVQPVNGTLASFIEKSPSLSLSTQLLMRHFQEVQDVLKRDADSQKKT